MGNEMYDDEELAAGTLDGVPVEDILGVPVEAFELWPLFGGGRWYTGWYLEVPYRRVEGGWPLAWRIRLRRDRPGFGRRIWY